MAQYMHIAATDTCTAIEEVSYVTINSQSASLSWCQAPIWGPTSDFYFCQAVAGLLIWVTLSDKRQVCHLQFLVAIPSAVVLMSESCGIHDHILLSHIGDSPNLEGQVTTFISPRNRVAQLYPQALGYLFVTYDSGLW
jgi:hypothetical protein